MLDEMVLAGELQEPSKKVTLDSTASGDSVWKSQIAGKLLRHLPWSCAGHYSGH